MTYSLQAASIKLPRGAALAPMAGVADLAFRKICREFGAALTYTEMVSAKALCYNDKKTAALLRLDPDEHPSGVQIFGSDPACMAEAAGIALNMSGADFVDLNMGCPTPKIVNSGDGGALMKNPRLAESIIRAVVNAVSAPVTVKFRLGWDKGSVIASEFAKMAEGAGAACICVHGRTCRQLYSGQADWAETAKVKAAVSIPVIANGDVVSPESFSRAFRITGADMIMIGRGAMGNPWLFEGVNAVLSGKPAPPPPSLEERCETVIRQIERASEYKGERIAVLEARKHYPWYLRGVPYCSRYKEMICKMTSLDEMRSITKTLLLDLRDRGYRSPE